MLTAKVRNGSSSHARAFFRLFSNKSMTMGSPIEAMTDAFLRVKLRPAVGAFGSEDSYESPVYLPSSAGNATGLRVGRFIP